MYPVANPSKDNRLHEHLRELFRLPQVDLAELDANGAQFQDPSRGEGPGPHHPHHRLRKEQVPALPVYKTEVTHATHRPHRHRQDRQYHKRVEYQLLQ